MTDTPPVHHHERNRDGRDFVVGDIHGHLQRLEGLLVHVDFDRTAALLINEFRSGKLGQITLETPAMAEKEHVKVAEIRARKAKEKEERKKARKAAYKAKAKKNT